MRPLLTLLLALFSLSSCNKKYADPSKWTYCQFSVKDANNQLLRSYHLRDGKMYDHSPNNVTIALTDEQYQKAEKVMNEIPATLTKDPTLTYSCFCPSFYKVVVEYQEDGRLYSWQIDLDSKNNPRRIQRFAEKVYTLIQELDN
jgi:hypothetical protein